jgi:hypothetical protein
MATRSNPEVDAFTRTIDHLLSVPREEMQRRIAEHAAKEKKQTKKRGRPTKAEAEAKLRTYTR